MPTKKELEAQLAASMTTTSPGPTSFVADLVKALQNSEVAEALGAIFDKRLKEVLGTVAALEKEKIVLKRDLLAANTRIEQLEAHDRKSNLIFTGLTPRSWSEATSQANADDASAEHTADTEKAVIELVENQLHVPVTPSDISIAHRLKKKPGNTAPAPIIVRFTNYKIRDAIYRARFNLKNVLNSTGQKLFINEDLTKSVAKLFREARELVKAKSLHGTWTAGGQVFIKRSNHPSCRAKKVSSETELRHVVLEDSN
jgi:hypothetical protein